MGAIDATEPPVGFSVAYYDARGLRVIPVRVAVHDARSEEELKGLLFQAYTALCHGMAPRNQQPSRNARRTIDAIMRSHGKEIRDELPTPIRLPATSKDEFT